MPPDAVQKYHLLRLLVMRVNDPIDQEFAASLNKEASSNLVPRVLSYPPTERERERPWKTLVTWLQNKIISEGGVLCLTFFVWFIRDVHAVIATAR